MKYIKTYEDTQSHKKYLVQEMYNVFTKFVVYENIKELPYNRLMLREVYKMTKDGALTPKLNQPNFTYNIGDVDWIYQSNDIDDVIDMLYVISNNKKYNI